MKLSSRFLLFVTFSILTVPTFAQDAVRPNPQVEAKAAQALVNLNMEQRKYTNNQDRFFHSLAISLARLGHFEDALNVLGSIKNQNSAAANGVPQTQAEVLRLSVRRSTALGDIAEARALISRIQNSHVRADAILALARAYLRNDNTQDALKVLFQVSPLVQDSFSATIYTAYLFSRSGDKSAAKRLFKRARGHLSFAATSLDVGTPEERDKNLKNAIHLSSFAHYLLKAGFVEEWLAFNKQAPHNFEPAVISEASQLIALHRSDVAIRLTRQLPTVSQFQTLIEIAQHLAPYSATRSQAISLLEEADTIFYSFPATLTKKYPRPDERKRRYRWFATSLAISYQIAGQDEIAQQRLQKALDGLPSEEKALTHIRFWITYLLITMDVDKKIDLGAEMSQVNTTIAPYLDQLQDPYQTVGLSPLIFEQIRTKQFNLARPNIEYLEKVALKLLPTATDINSFGNALFVAGIWKQIGDETRAAKIISLIINSPQFQKYSKADTANWVISQGFVAEGRRLLKALPKDQRTSTEEFAYPMVIITSGMQPQFFPKQITKIDNPVKQSSILSDFARALTWSIFNSAGQRDMTLYANGTTIPG